MSTRLFFSGTPSLTSQQKYTLGSMIKRRLNSCHGDYMREAMLWGAVISQPESTIDEWMLDSGAFTAWSRGDDVTLDGVIERYDRVMATMTRTDVKVWLINLDVIPGSRGVDPTAQQLDDAMRQSDINFEILVKRYGPCVLPVFHQGESEARLEAVKQQATYIGVSPRNDLPEKVRVTWAAQVHTLLGKTRSHGLAATGDVMVRTVPWWSVDSASWLYTAAMGGITIMMNGKLVKLSMSDRSPNIKDLGEHFDTLPAVQRDMVVGKIAAAGLTVEGLRTSANQRVFFCAIENQRWADAVSCSGHVQESLFAL